MIYGRDNREIVGQIRRHTDFQDFVVPIDQLDEIRDATFFLRNDGLLAFSEGYYHPEGKLVGNIIYIPDPAGVKRFFGVPYASVIKSYGPGEEEWITFEEQVKQYEKIDPGTQENKPVFAENKCVFNLDDFIGFVPVRRSLHIARERSANIDRVIRDIAALFSLDPGMIGCTGSMAFGNIAAAHDFDLVFHGPVARMREIVDTIREIVKDPARQVFEMGMLWAIRFYDDERNMICPFFSYTRQEEIPLPRFDMVVCGRDREAVATIADDRHTGFMPSFLPIAEVVMKDGDELRDPALIIYHGGKRGEYLAGDRVRIRGHLVEVSTPSRLFDALLVTDMGNTEKEKVK